MAIDSSDHLARTIEFQTASIHLAGEFAGAIEVPIFVGQPNLLHGELDDLTLQVEGEQQLLRPARREFFAGQLRLTYFSKFIRDTGRLPSALQLHWGDTAPENSCGMELMFRKAPGTGSPE